jgi:hypothetical protein
MNSLKNISWSAKLRLVMAAVCLTLLLLTSIAGSAQTTVKATPDSIADPAKPLPVVLHLTKADGSTPDTDVAAQVTSVSVGSKPKVDVKQGPQAGDITITPPPNLSGQQSVQLLDKDGKSLGQAQLTYGGAGGGDGARPQPSPEAAPTPCPAGLEARVKGVKPPVVGGKPRDEVQLGDVIDVQVENYQCLQAQARAAAGRPERNIVLFLDDMPVLKGTAYPPADPKPSGDPLSTTLKFTLRPTYKPEEGARDIWTTVLGSPSLTENKPVKVSIGIEDQYAIPAANNVIKLDIVPLGWFAFWLLVFAVLVIAFFMMAWKTDLLRDAVPPPGGGARRPFSLARTQAAWWFFLVLAAYLFIGIITGDFLTSITGTALGLLGISAGTTLGSAFVDAGKAQSPEVQAQEARAGVELQTEIDQLNEDVAKLKKGIADQPAGINDPVKNVDLAAKNAELETKKSQLSKLNNVSEDPLRDILSDANGVSFHRFQMVAWALVLGIIFVVQVYRVLAIPKFDTTLLTLLGISAGTFVGLKIPEPTNPTGKK